MNGSDLILRIEHSSFPNWTGTEQKRTNLTLTGDELKYTNNAPSVGGPPAVLAWRRAHSKRERAEAHIVVGSRIMFLHRQQIGDFAAKNRLILSPAGITQIAWRVGLFYRVEGKENREHPCA